MLQILREIASLRMEPDFIDYILAIILQEVWKNRNYR